MNHQKNVPITKLTSYKSRGTVPDVITFDKLSELKKYILSGSEYCILGKGSNTIINSAALTTPIIKISPDITQAQVNNTELIVNAGVSVTTLLSFLKQFQLSGLEFVAGVPASIGGMIAMNFGCWGKTISELVKKVRIINKKGEDIWLDKDQLEFGYRTSNVTKKEWVVVEVAFQLTKMSKLEIEAEIKKNIRVRKESQPLQEKTFGSIFKNPIGTYAGVLIEKAGLKGTTTKTVKISERHANFLVNIGNATFSETINTITAIQNEVFRKDRINLELEVKIIE